MATGLPEVDEVLGLTEKQRYALALLALGIPISTIHEDYGISVEICSRLQKSAPYEELRRRISEYAEENFKPLLMLVSLRLRDTLMSKDEKVTVESAALVLQACGYIKDRDIRLHPGQIT